MPDCQFISVDAKLSQDLVTKVRWVSLHVVALTKHRVHKDIMHSQLMFLGFFSTKACIIYYLEKDV